MKRAISTALLPSILILAGSAMAAPKLNGDNLAASLTLGAYSYPHVAGNNPSTMEATYTVSNPTSQPIVYIEGGLGVDWKVVDSHGQLIYDVNKGKMTPHFLVRRILQPGDHQSFKSSIKLQSQDGAPLPTGQYTLKAHLTTDDSLQTNKTFTVK